MGIYIKDTKRFIGKLSLGKILNATKVVSSFYATKWFKKPIQWGQPFTISVEPTTACNLRCPECPSGLRAFSRPTGNLKTSLFNHTIDQVHKNLLYLIFYFQGEPFINPDFLEMVRYAHKKKIYTITSTNGHFLNDENAKETIQSGLDRIIISVDGTTQEVYESYRKEGTLSNVIKGIENIVKWKKELKSNTPHIIIQFLVVKPNEHQIDDVIQLGKGLGVDEVKLKSAQIYDYENGNPLIPSIDKYSRYKKTKTGKYKVKGEIINACWKLWHSCVITWDGIVVPCCFDKDATHHLGDVSKEPLDKIWYNDEIKNFRKSIVKGREHIEICKNCTEGCKVWL